MKNFGLLAIAGLLASGIMQADSIQASLYSPFAPAGAAPVIVNLSGITPVYQGTVMGSGYMISFPSTGYNTGVVQGAGSGYALPVAGVTGTTPEYLTGGFGSALTTNAAASGNYLSTGTGEVVITFSAPETSFALLWGSIDTSNSLSFNDAADYVVTGSAVQNAAGGFVGNGYQGPGGSAYVIVNTSTPFTQVIATSSSASFEFAGVSAAASSFTTTPSTTAPEPEMALLMLPLGIAFLWFRRKA